MSTFPRKIPQNSRSDAWQQPINAGMTLDAARALRDLAAQLGAELPKYLLAPEVAVLLSYFDDLNRRMYFDTLWNTGARPSEARALTPSDFILDPSRPHPQPVLRIKTLKQREQDATRGPGRPPIEVPPSPHPDARYRKPPEPKTRLVPLLDARYAQRMREFLATWRRRVKHQPVWPVSSRQTPVNWLKEALDRAARDGVTFSVPVTPHTFRHSFAMHLLMCGVPDKTLQALMGHRYGRSTEVYTRVFTLDAMAAQGISFSVDPLNYKSLI
ncbi:tyrosine-type recombinase/integrase [Erwinia sp. V90_4]|uniref:tyrosine-type recombinase/integrase n=2 Tax=Erwinia TaxID=551 RepID=UPI00249DCE72|nr:tyrosine-type recombinase/integrase [Erwinia sp. V90_4]MDI3440220.1 tyrosine-type recombinase/integrase [Erwinia sp. V90_4]